MTAINIINGIKNIGIYPLNENAVIKKLFGKATFSNEPNMCTAFTPLKRQPYRLTPVGTDNKNAQALILPEITHLNSNLRCMTFLPYGHQLSK